MNQVNNESDKRLEPTENETETAIDKKIDESIESTNAETIKADKITDSGGNADAYDDDDFGEGNDTYDKHVGNDNDGEDDAKPKHGYYDGVNILKFWLMPFVCFASFGLPGTIGGMISHFSLFAPNAFYILCGFFLADRESKETNVYGRTIKRTFWRFLLLFVICFICNVLVYLSGGVLGEVMASLLNKRTIFNFIVLCIWPFLCGETIWFIQSLLYARVGLWLMNKFNLMRFYKPIMIICIALMLLFGEFSGIIGFNFHGYTYIPANVITRALPYMLLGRWLYENQERLFKVRPIMYVLGFILGIILSYGEVMLLSSVGRLNYTGHMIGFGIMAFSVCCLFLGMKANRQNFFALHGRNYAWRIYALSQPIALVLLMLSSMGSALGLAVVQAFGGIIVYLICLFLAFLMGYTRHLIKQPELR